MRSIVIGIYLILNIAFVNKIWSQDAFDRQIISLKEKYPMPSLTKDQMYEDFDTLFSIMKNCNAQYLIRKKVTGFDMLQKMNQIRNQIDTITSTSSFIRLLKNAMSFTQDQHCNIGDNVWWYRHSFYKKEVRHFKNRDFGYNFHYLELFRENEMPLKLIQIDQRYYLKYPTRFYLSNDSILVKAGAEIILVNNINTSIFIDSISKDQFNTQWDFKNKLFYTNSLSKGKVIKQLSLLINNQLLEFNVKSYEQKIPKFNHENVYFDNVKYIAQDSILLIRISSMIYSIDRMKKIQDDILKFKHYRIKKVAIDIRGNGGGSDKKWIYLLQSIIESPIKYQFSIITNDNDESSKYMPDRLKNKKIKFNFIDSNYIYRVNYDEESYIEPFKNNLGYTGKIYILQDEDIYSSSKSFCSLNTKTDRIITVGVQTGKLVGQGGNPRVFILPNTKLIFTLDVVLDASGVKKAEDFYHDSLNYPVTPSLNYYLYRLNRTKEELLEEKYLHEFDEIYIKLLEL